VIDGDVLGNRGGWPSTSATLLGRVQRGGNDDDAWGRFVALYRPLVFKWCSDGGRQPSDAEDVCQEVFRAVSGAIGTFEHGRNGGTLRGWLRRITTNAAADWGRRRNKGEPLGAGGSDAHADMLAVPAPSADDTEDEATTRAEERMLLRQAVMGILTDFQPQTRDIFCRVVVDRETPADVARALGVKDHVVYLAKSRVLKRLREEYADLIDLEQL
jgi:RNA polymerase sigma-70 factor (ECF subfamily)